MSLDLTPLSTGRWWASALMWTAIVFAWAAIVLGWVYVVLDEMRVRRARRWKHDGDV